MYIASVAAAVFLAYTIPAYLLAGIHYPRLNISIFNFISECVQCASGGSTVPAYLLLVHTIQK